MIACVYAWDTLAAVLAIAVLFAWLAWLVAR